MRAAAAPPPADQVARAQQQQAGAGLPREVVRELAALALHALPAGVEAAPEELGGRDAVVREVAGGAAEASALHEEGAGL